MESSKIWKLTISNSQRKLGWRFEAKICQTKSILAQLNMHCYVHISNPKIIKHAKNM